MKHEEILHKQVCQYLKAQFPHLIFMSEPSGMRVASWGLKKTLKALRSNDKLPDLFIAKPNNAGKHGLFIELKRQGTVIYLKNGELSTNEHIQGQAKILQRLNNLGYVAAFGCGFDEVKTIINRYFTEI